MLKVAHVLALDLVGSGSGGEALGSLGFGGSVRLVLLTVVNNDPQALFEFFKARDDGGIVEVIANDADDRGFVGDGVVEHFENRAACFEAHPLERFVGLRMARDEVKAFIGCGWDEGIEAVRVGGVVIYESLGAPAVPWVGFAGEDDACFLLFAVAEFAGRTHKHRRDTVGEFTFLFSVHGEVRPAEFLNW